MNRHPSSIQHIVSGAAMDTHVPLSPWRRYRARAAGAAALAVLILAWQCWPRGLRVAAADLQIARVQRGVLADEIVVRAVAPGRRIGRIVEPGRIRLAAEVDEYYLGRVAPGNKGSAQVAGRAWPIEVTRRYRHINGGRFRIELAFAGAGPVLGPGQGVDVHIALGEAGMALLLPDGAYLDDNGGMWLFVLDGKEARRRNVTLGRRANGQVEVVAGLAEGEDVIVSPYASFGSAMRVQVVK